MTTHETEDRFVLETLKKWPLSIVRGEGVYVYDEAGRKYLDFYGGHAVCGIGHCHPRLVEAIRDQAGRLIFYSNAVYNDRRAEAARLVCENAYPSSSAVFFCNSGTEANETAIKIARRATGRPRIVAMEDGFHGRTIGSLSATGNPKLRDQFPQNLGHLTDFVPFGEIEALESAVTKDTAAIILEPIQSVGGVRLGNRRFYQVLRELSAEFGCALIFDEVQTGFGRTGSMFAGTHWKVEPDLVTTAKAAAGGFPVGMVILSEAIRGAPAPGEHGCTFGGGPLAMAAVAATVQVLVDEKLAENARRMEVVIRDGLGAIPLVQAVRGKGLLLGIDLSCDAAPVIDALREQGVLVGGSSKKNQIRLLPPLTIGEEHVSELAAAMAEVGRTLPQTTGSEA